MKAEALLVAAGAFALCSTAVRGAYEPSDRCQQFKFDPKSCAEALIAEGWQREFTLPSKSMDAGVYYDVWRKGQEAILCSSHWGRGRQTTMGCDLMQPVTVKN